MTPHSLATRSALALVLLAAACDDSPSLSPPERTLEEIRDATRAFQQVAAATAAGYAPAGPCVAHPSMGAMGFHYSRADLVDASVNPRQPEVLLYGRGTNGELQLLGVEFMVPAAAWDAIHSTPPQLAGVTFDDHRDPAARHGLPFAHYDLHAWAWRENPSGDFVPFNPTVTC